jgi:hypothetical protein
MIKRLFNDLAVASATWSMRSVDHRLPQRCRRRHGRPWGKNGTERKSGSVRELTDQDVYAVVPASSDSNAWPKSRIVLTRGGN